jgi:transposase
MYEGYANAAEEELPGAPQVVDRFHVAKAYRGCADKLRKEELRVLKNSLKDDEYGALTRLCPNYAGADKQKTTCSHSCFGKRMTSAI